MVWESMRLRPPEEDIKSKDNQLQAKVYMGYKHLSLPLIPASASQIFICRCGFFTPCMLQHLWLPNIGVTMMVLQNIQITELTNLKSSLMFALTTYWTNCRIANDLRRHDAHVVSL